MSERPFWERYHNLALTRLGASVLQASDDFFGAKERLIDEPEPVFLPGKYDDHGKWMDGWESRRKRGPGHDWCVVELGFPVRLKGVDIDTSHFNGNQPARAALHALEPGHYQSVGADPREVLAAVPLSPSAHHRHAINRAVEPVQALRLDIFPDGGVARLRVYGEPVCDWAALGERTTRSATLVDLVAIEHGGRAVACNDEHFGKRSNLVMPGRGVNMGDGWETRRRREPGNDWVVLALGGPGEINRIAVDTAHFKGNYPDRCSMQAALVPAEHSDETLITASAGWPELLPSEKLEADQIHEFQSSVRSIGPVTHVRINIFPDGGLSRVRLFGRPVVHEP